jgi:hypothetical protein
MMYRFQICPSISTCAASSSLTVCSWCTGVPVRRRCREVRGAGRRRYEGRGGAGAGTAPAAPRGTPPPRDTPDCLDGAAAAPAAHSENPR